MKRAVVITASNRAFKGVYEDLSGQILLEGLKKLGYEINDVQILPDDQAQISDAIQTAINSEIDLVVTTGGTGVSAFDVTPEATAPLVLKPMPGILEALRAYAREQVPTTDLSRGIAGVTNKSLIINLPGSPGGAKDGLVIIERLASHIHDQLAGHDHSPSN
ncbi:MAG: MogA/MoaB family molybdenum cofactor biosynthesis protein [Candidatus Planktophila sp.]|jgi:molybdenum cofactor synthesis domain-containing protein|tara:strand:+ start:8699 stop:9184 length:486 start_codon:yes stop_codon:yes gene_type:complete